MVRFLGGFFIFISFVFIAPALADHDGAKNKARDTHQPLALPYALQCTPLGELLTRNGSLPKNDSEWDRFFRRIDSTGPDIYFSQSRAHTSLLDPRRIYMAKSNEGEGVKGGSFFGRVFVALGKNDEGNRVAEFITAGPKGHSFLFGTIDPSAYSNRADDQLQGMSQDRGSRVHDLSLDQLVGQYQQHRSASASPRGERSGSIRASA